MADDSAPLDQPCEAPGCNLLNGDHSAEETTAYIERWLTALAESEASR